MVARGRSERQRCQRRVCNDFAALRKTRRGVQTLSRQDRAGQGEFWNQEGAERAYTLERKTDNLVSGSGKCY